MRQKRNTSTPSHSETKQVMIIYVSYVYCTRNVLRIARVYTPKILIYTFHRESVGKFLFSPVWCQIHFYVNFESENDTFWEMTLAASKWWVAWSGLEDSDIGTWIETMPPKLAVLSNTLWVLTESTSKLYIELHKSTERPVSITSQCAGFKSLGGYDKIIMITEPGHATHHFEAEIIISPNVSFSDSKST